MNMKPLAREQQLQRTRQELAQRLERIRRDHSHADAPLEADFAEQSVQRQNDEVLDRIEDSTRRDLDQVEHALAHLARGGGDRCEGCGEPIASERLAAMPHATQCADCARQLGSPAAANAPHHTPLGAT